MEPQQDRQNSQAAKYILLTSLFHESCLATLTWMSQEYYLYPIPSTNRKTATFHSHYYFFCSFKCQSVDIPFSKKGQKTFLFFKSSILKSNFVERSQECTAPSEVKSCLLADLVQMQKTNQNKTTPKPPKSCPFSQPVSPHTIHSMKVVWHSVSKHKQHYLI